MHSPDSPTHRPADPPPWSPVARGPFAARQRACGAEFGRLAEWEVALRFAAPEEELRASREGIAVADLCHLPKSAWYGAPARPAAAQSLPCPAIETAEPGTVVITSAGQCACVLTARQVLAADLDPSRERKRGGADSALTVPGGTASPNPHPLAPSPQSPFPGVYHLDRTGALASLALVGPQVPALLQRLTCFDTAPESFPAGRCAQTAVTGVWGLLVHVGHNHYQLHVDRADGERTWDAIMQSGQSLAIRPIGWERYRGIAAEAWKTSR